MSDPDDKTGNSRPRAELSEFLRAKRGALKRSDFGISSAGATRAKGLRREDIAHLTHVSLSWYTWLEQGKDISVSSRFLVRLADTLKLNDAERRYLFRLCDRQAPDGSKILDARNVGSRLARMLGAIGGPAFIINLRWDIVAANRYAEAFMGIRLADQEQAPNVLKLVFLDDAHRALMPDWEHVARHAVAKFRLDSSESGIAEMRDLAAELRSSSAEFDRFWNESDVASRQDETRVFVHPQVGEMRFGYTLFDVGDRRDLRLSVYVAEDDSTQQRLDRLMRISDADQRPRS